MRNRLSSHIRLRVLLGAFFALILLFVVFGGSAQKSLTNIGLNFFDPLFKLSKTTNSFFEDISFIFANKERLAKENEDLREALTNLKGNIESIEVIKKDNESLRAMLGRETNEHGVLASIILRPPESLYDVFIIDVGMRDKIEEGMKVTTPGGIFLGNISEVFEKTSKVTLVSYFNKETNVLLESLELPTIAVGIGAYTMQIQLPKDVASIEVGERVLTLGTMPYLVGFVEEIKTESADSLQTVLLRTPLNISHIRSVLVI